MDNVSSQPLCQPPPPPSTNSNSASCPHHGDAKPKTRRPRNRQCSDEPLRVDGRGKRTSIYRGVTRHRWTGRYEAHLWDKNYWNKAQNKKGRQVYLGAYENEEAAARTYDLAALKYWGLDSILNFPASTYAEEFREMQGMTKEDYLASLRRRSSGFSRGASKYRGVARHHHNGRWEARIGRVYGNKYLYLGTFSTQEEAAQAYDRAALIYRGQRAVTNFDISHYTDSKPSLRPPTVSAPPMPPQLMASFEPPTTFRSFEKLSSPMEPPVLASSDGLGDLTWTTCIDSSYDSFPISDLLTDGFVDDIEQLFDGSEMGGGDVSGGDRVSAISPVETSGVAAPSPVAPFAASEMRSAKSFAFPISICT
ncbi:hypothetical protein HPP92_021208 [Vanilla planifolia]|uniref:AP2/ERF domain-containing protein n=1 Tax=Vanilla planifolia TaxID=51239 RepID=A0A835PUZ8_VANPL|nr:hypothetical protein HPP92_021208 [Vanilla planifolia]